MLVEVRTLSRFREHVHIRRFNKILNFNCRIQKFCRIGNSSRTYCDDTRMNLFKSKDHAKLYAAFRPTYPHEVFDRITEFCKESKTCSFSRALDLGCGSGQSTKPLTQYFSHVTGVDVSKSQIDQAKKKYPDIEFRVGPAEDLSAFHDSTVDLVTIAQAFHWVDQSKFFPEVTRVLKPGGSLVVYGYGLNKIDNDEVQRYINYFYGEVLKGYWETGRQHVEIKYQDFKLPYPGWKRDDSLEIRLDWSVANMIGYVSTWSAWQQFMKDYPNTEELDSLEDKLKKCYPERGLDAMITIRWPIFMLMGHKPI